MAELIEKVDECICPECGGHDFTYYTWKKPMILHWILNPGAGVVEFLLGLRLPKTMMVCNSCQKSWGYRCYIRCPECGGMHKSGVWAGWNGFGHWLGYACPDCGAAIPCFWNILSILLLCITAPIWILPVCLWRRNWLEFESRRAVKGRQAYERKMSRLPRQISIMRDGVCFFGGLLCVSLVIFQIVQRSFSSNPAWSDLWGLIPLYMVSCAAGGALFGYLMKRFPNRKTYPDHVQDTSEKQ